MDDFDANNDGASNISKGYKIALIFGWVLAINSGVVAYLNYKTVEELHREIQVLKAQQPVRQASAE